MWIAAIGNIHGNLPAFEAVLADIDEAGIHTILNTGDCIVGDIYPNEVVDVIRTRAIHTVQGLMDRHAATFLKKRYTLARKLPADFTAIAWTYEHLRSDNLEFIRALPKMTTLTLEGIGIALCHGTPSGQHDALYETDPDGRFRRQRERAPEARLIVCGRTHRPFARWVDHTLFVNPGAVGVSHEGRRRATYALISTEEEPWQVDIRQVAYAGRA